MIKKRPGGGGGGRDVGGQDTRPGKRPDSPPSHALGRGGTFSHRAEVAGVREGHGGPGSDGCSVVDWKVGPHTGRAAFM